MTHTIENVLERPAVGHIATAIEATRLTRNFNAKPAVDGLDLCVAAGEIYGFLGPNGAGKSTAVRMLCTLLKPSGGKATVAGHDVEREPLDVRRKIGVALQDVALDEGQTGRELLVLQGRLYGLSSAAARHRVDDVLDLVDIGDAIDRRINTYSGGMKRRLDLAAALVHFPEVLFLDEPTTGLDPHSRITVWSEVRRLNADLSMTIFLTTQYLEEADALADRVGILRTGKLVAEGPPTELKRALGDDLVVAEVEGHDSRAVDRLALLNEVDDVTWEQGRLTIRTPDASAALAPIAQLLGDVGVNVRSITLTKPTLDDVFMALTGSDVEGERASAEALR
jgi:ABC-2 type transport system ATP-binding protein